MKANTVSLSICWIALLMIAPTSSADGLKIDKVYLPYVNPLETELEYRFLGLDKNNDTAQLHRFGYGRGLSERLAGEFSAEFENSDEQHGEVKSYELELRYQLSEQGEFAADWGLIAELEKSQQLDVWGLGAGFISSRQWGKWSAVINALFEIEWGEDIKTEQEFAARGHLLYRLSEGFEPSIEVHLGQDTAAAGPVAKGLIRQGPGKKWRWELGILGGINTATPDLIFKADIEFEFN